MMEIGDSVQFIDEERMYRNVYRVLDKSMDIDGETKLYKILHTKPPAGSCFSRAVWVKEADIVRV